MANVKRTREQSLEEIKKIREELPDMKITQDIATVLDARLKEKCQLKH